MSRIYPIWARISTTAPQRVSVFLNSLFFPSCIPGPWGAGPGENYRPYRYDTSGSFRVSPPVSKGKE